MAIEIVDFPIKNCDFPYQRVNVFLMISENSWGFNWNQCD
jgi:hypothetical protein